MRPRIFALPAPSPSPRRQPQPHELSGSASSPFMGPPRLPIGPHHPPHTWHPPPRFLIRSHPPPILGLFVPPPSPLCGLGSRIPPTHEGLKCTSSVHTSQVSEERNAIPHPHTVLPLAPLHAPSSPPRHWPARLIILRGVHVRGNSLARTLSHHSRCPRPSSPLCRVGSRITLSRGTRMYLSCTCRIPFPKIPRDRRRSHLRSLPL